MAIKKHLSYDFKLDKISGNINLGELLEGIDEDNEASEALVVMATGLKSYWKIPLAYFFTNNILAILQKQLVENIISSLNERKLNVLSLTMDGHSTNVSMAKLFGCDFNATAILRDECLTNFCINSNKCPIYIFFDPCHMLKLIRNMLEAYKEIKSEKGIISWNYFNELNEYQRKLGLKLANKLSSKHINFQNHKMNVKLAAQLLSNSVADSMKFLLESGEHNFKDSEETIKFIKVNFL